MIGGVILTTFVVGFYSIIIKSYYLRRVTKGVNKYLPRQYFDEITPL